MVIFNSYFDITRGYILNKGFDMVPDRVLGIRWLWRSDTSLARGEQKLLDFQCSHDSKKRDASEEFEF